MRRYAVLLLAALAVGAAVAPSSAAPAFAAASQASVRPGAQTFTPVGQCTANFFFRDGAGNVLVGQSAHCASLGEPTDTNGCTTRSLPLGTPVQVAGARFPGTLVYSSWVAMQRRGERDPNACQYNDFALVRLHPDDVARSNPTVPVFGGPNELDRDGTRSGEAVVTYGSSELRLGVRELSPKRGFSLGSGADRWTHDVYTATPGVPGDSGSGVMDDRGRAIGTLSTLGALPYPAANGVSDLQRQLSYARANGMPGTTLIPGTVAFKGWFA